jgi:FkbM family methyltransferase
MLPKTQYTRLHYSAMHSLIRLIRGFVRRSGFDVVRFPSAEGSPVLAFVRRFNIDTVIDVGANRGQYARHLRQDGYTGRIISFEPNPDDFAHLERAAKQDENWDCFNLGMGERAGQVVLHVAELSTFSSLLLPTAAGEQADSRNRTVKDVPVNITTLDQFWNDHGVGGNVLLKIDTQGYERSILLGARKVLPFINGLQLELSLESLYSDQPLIEDVLPLVRQAGFTPYSLWKGFAVDSTGATMEVDGLFYRRP